MYIVSSDMFWTDDKHVFKAKFLLLCAGDVEISIFMLHCPKDNKALSNASRFFLIQCSLFSVSLNSSFEY